MKDDLVEKVARAIYAASGGETPDFVLESVPDWELYDSEARAAIRVVVEECLDEIHIAIRDGDSVFEAIRKLAQEEKP